MIYAPARRQLAEAFGQRTLGYNSNLQLSSEYMAGARVEDLPARSTPGPHTDIRALVGKTIRGRVFPLPD